MSDQHRDQPKSKQAKGIVQESIHRPIYCIPQKLPDFIAGININHLANLRSQKRGPKYVTRGRRVYYLLDDVIRWLTEHPVKTTDQQD